MAKAAYQTPIGTNNSNISTHTDCTTTQPHTKTVYWKPASQTSQAATRGATRYIPQSFEMSRIRLAKRRRALRTMEKLENLTDWFCGLSTTANQRRSAASAVAICSDVGIRFGDSISKAEWQVALSRDLGGEVLWSIFPLAIGICDSCSQTTWELCCSP